MPISAESMQQSRKSSAATLWGFPGFKEGSLEVEGIPVTAPHRTLLDVAATALLIHVEESLDDLVRRGLVSLPRMSWELDEYACNGRDGVEVMRQLLAARQAGAVPQSVLETKFLRILRKSGLPEPECQFAIRERGKVLAIIDFAYPSELIAIEVDGFVITPGRR